MRMILKEPVSQTIWILLCVFLIQKLISSPTQELKPLYHISQGKLIEYRLKTTLMIICRRQCQFTSTKIQLNNSDTIFMFGRYSDQFGGKFHKNIKQADLKAFC